MWSRIAEAFDGDDRVSSLSPTRRDFRKTLERTDPDISLSSQCKVAHLNADEATARPISSKYGVSGFPTLKFLSPPSKGSKVDTYQGPRTEDAFLEYLNEKCGTQKGKGGILNELAGRIPSLDRLAKLYLAPATLRTALLSQAEDLVKSAKFDEGKAKGMKDYYLRLFKKWSQLAEDNVGDAKLWIDKELARLRKLAAKKGQIQVEKLEEVKMKQNVSRSFFSL